MQINRKLLLMKMNYFFGVGGLSPFSPFLTTILKQRGYSAFIVGLIFMLQPIPGIFVRPIIGAVTDKYKCRRLVLISSSIILFTLIFLVSIIPGTTSKEEMSDLDVFKSPLFWLFITTATLINSCTLIKSVLDETICMDLLGKDQHNYGKQRLWGSIGWSLMAIFSGACVDWYSAGQEYKNYAPGYAIALICLFINIFVVCEIEVKQDKDTKVVASDVKKVLTEGKVLAFLLWVMFLGFFMSFIWNFVFWYIEDLVKLYHPEMKPWIKTLQGIALIIQCFLGEVPTFFLSSYILKRVDHITMISVVFFTFTVIFSSYSFIANPLWVFPVQSLNGIVFGLSYSAAISYAARIAPAGAEGTLQGIVGTVYTGIGAPIGSLVGGYMFKNMGSIGSFNLLSVIAFVTFSTHIIVTYLMNRILSKKEDVKEIDTEVKTNDDNIEEHKDITLRSLTS